MFAVLLIFVAALAGCIRFDKKIHEMLPAALFAVTLGVYALGLFLSLSVSVWIVCAIVAVSLATSIILVLFGEREPSAGINIFSKKTWSGLNVRISKKCGRGDICEADVVSESNQKSLTRGNKRKRLFGNYIYTRTASPQFFILVIVCTFFCILLSNRHVFFYDDLSYWALYTKNIFAIDHLPHLFENCSVDYKDYTPIIQILQYIALFGRKTFSESVMYQTNICLIYILLLPLLSGIEDKTRPVAIRIASVVMYVIFPHILTAQFYYRLGVDLFMALAFGYALYLIFADEENEMWKMTCLVLDLSFLTLIKSSAVVLSIFALVFYVVKQSYLIKGKSKKPFVIKTLILCVFMFGSYLSWNMFLRWSWNNGYLTNRIKSGVKSGSFAFPEYTREVVLNYIGHFFTYPLTRNTYGITAFTVVVFMVLVFAVLCITKKSRKEDTALFVTAVVCFVIFALAHMSMYLFIFDEWEAHGLLEFDRYITQYLGGTFFVYVFVLMQSIKSSEDRAASRMLYVFMAVFIALLPYADMQHYLIPANYEASYESGHAKTAQNATEEWEASGAMALELPHDGSQRLTMIADSWDEKTQFIEYTAVPQPIDRILNVSAVEPGKLAGFIYEYLEQYVYVAVDTESAYNGNWQETAELTEDGQPLRGGVLYRVSVENDNKTLVPVL